MHIITKLGSALLLGLSLLVPAEAKPLKVYILAGQSNMEGQGAHRTFDYIGDDPATAPLLKEMRGADGKPRVCEDVWISYNGTRSGKLDGGYGGACVAGKSGDRIGPEFTFGLAMEKATDEPILIIKTAWGGKSLHTDFRSPSAGPYELSAFQKAAYPKQEGHGIPKDFEQWKTDKQNATGHYYRLMMSHIRKVLGDIRQVYPDYDPAEGYELGGFVWFQGWNDYCDGHTYPDRSKPGGYDHYADLLGHFIRDVRKDLAAPKLPFVIGVFGVRGVTDPDAAAVHFREAMTAPALMPEFNGNVVAVPTAPFWDETLEPLYWKNRKLSGMHGRPAAELAEYRAKNFTPEEEALWKRGGSNGDYHYLGSAKTFALTGRAFAEAILEMQSPEPPDFTHLAPTPPMGWNSWNFFAKDIDEAKIKAVADAMVSSGMRDAGYEYLVLDDAWMAAERDANFALQADPKKFPKGMKELGDYIHSKGLKFGIYQDRAWRTCQSLPGSFGHEKIDMQTFADWGVDYIKMDSCSAEHNFRLSSEDYAIYRRYIEETGRPMVLSISDFGNAAWVWGGKKSSQLWRTGWDIRSKMGSVYNCAECSAGSKRSHPAFNGLWQFAGPGYWNDPDMLQVGNFKIADDTVRDAANRAHFGLWCILAAPLMAGNDMPVMTDAVRDILTAPEVIAVNQDKRGLQGYKVFVDGDLEVYNKPLADGSTAVFLLNKGRKEADITVTWKMIGLKGKQPVRDLWERKDLGIFKKSFTAKGLGEHGNMMLKIGRTGEPLPAPDPMPLEKYTITRKGVTSLSDLYYAWRDKNAPVYNKTFEGKPIRIAGKTYDKGFGCKSMATFMFAGTERGDRLQGTVALDESYQGDNEGRFRIFHEDYFANRVIWDSGPMTKDTPPKEIDVHLTDYNCLMLVFEGRNPEKDDKAGDVLGVFGDPRIIVNDGEPSEPASSRAHGTVAAGEEEKKAGEKGGLAGRRPNIIIMMADDFGYSDLGCYGSEVRTPNLDKLATDGLRFTSFYNAGRCCPTRASLLTGLYPHQAGVGEMVNKKKSPGYLGRLNDRCVTIAEALRPSGYATMAVGKWHVSYFDYRENHASHRDTWPLQRGFDRFYGTVSGGGSYYSPLGLFRGNKAITVDTDPEYPVRDYYYTDAISDHASEFVRDHAEKKGEESDKPFFMYVAYTAPHWPLHAIEEDVAKYRELYRNSGWDKLRKQRYRKLIDLGLIDPACRLSPRDAKNPAWTDAEDPVWEAERMAVYAAQIDRMDQGIGRISRALKQTGQLDDTIIFFLADNGGCHEDLGDWAVKMGIVTAPKGVHMEFGNIKDPLPGPSNTFASYGYRWANVSNVPFRRYKHWIHEGGIASPLIVHWPNGIDREKNGKLRKQATHIIDLMATCVDLSGGAYPRKRGNEDVTPMEGESLLPVLNENRAMGRKQLAWEHLGNQGIRQGKWKLVSVRGGEWELYDMQTDRTELDDRIGDHPELAEKMKRDWKSWADRVGVFPK